MTRDSPFSITPLAVLGAEPRRNNEDSNMCAAKGDEDVEKSLIRLLNTVYGPYAFGTVMLLIVWYSIMQPTLANNRVDTGSLANVARELSRVADSVGRSAELVNNAVNKMDRIAEKLSSIKSDGVDTGARR